MVSHFYASCLLALTLSLTGCGDGGTSSATSSASTSPSSGAQPSGISSAGSVANSSSSAGQQTISTGGQLPAAGQLIITRAADGSLISPAQSNSATAVQIVSLAQAGSNSSNPDATQKLQLAQIANPSLSSSQLCGVDFLHYQYTTMDAQSQPTTASGVVMVPHGGGSECTGPRPVVLYAHGTILQQAMNLADYGNTSDPDYGELTTLMTMYAAQGYIVIAPNYAGYDTSPLNYHPYLQRVQQGNEMIDALKAGRELLSSGLIYPQGQAPATDSGKLFVTGASEGGYVAMAAAKAMDAAGIAYTAAMPISGPYAIAAQADILFQGALTLAVPPYPLIVNSYQQLYGGTLNLEQSGADTVFNSAYQGLLTTFPISGTMPTMPELAFSVLNTRSQQLLNQYCAANSSSPLCNQPTILFNPAYQQDYLAAMTSDPATQDGALNGSASPMPATNPGFPFRQALVYNDLRGYLPAHPLLMCGGHQDSVVYFANTLLMGSIMSQSGAGLQYGMLDMDNGSYSIPVVVDPSSVDAYTNYAQPIANRYTPNALTTLSGRLSPQVMSALNPQTSGSPTNQLQSQFATALSQQPGSGNYHGLTSIYCSAAALTYFNQF